MKKTFFIFLFAFSLLQSCGEMGHQGNGTTTITLDNGNRWQANPETTSGIAEMQAIQARYEGRTSDAASRKAMREEVEAAFQLIFKQCTMTGDAHEQLHNYLLPMKVILEKVGSERTAESEAAIVQLKQHLAEYQNYFQ